MMRNEVAKEKLLVAEFVEDDGFEIISSINLKEWHQEYLHEEWGFQQEEYFDKGDGIYWFLIGGWIQETDEYGTPEGGWLEILEIGFQPKDSPTPQDQRIIKDLSHTIDFDDGMDDTPQEQEIPVEFGFVDIDGEPLDNGGIIVSSEEKAKDYECIWKGEVRRTNHEAYTRKEGGWYCRQCGLVMDPNHGPKQESQEGEVCPECFGHKVTDYAGVREVCFACNGTGREES